MSQPKLVKIRPCDVAKLKANGYCRVSRKHRMLARLDRPDWREHMARKHSPWSFEEGTQWASASGMADHYRRCYSTDVIQLHESQTDLFMKFPPSGGVNEPTVFVGKSVMKVNPEFTHPPVKDRGQVADSLPDEPGVPLPPTRSPLKTSGGGLNYLTIVLVLAAIAYYCYIL